jgi:hypothetical protein
MTDPLTKEKQVDCLEGCDGSHKHAWEIEPHYRSDFDVLVCDHDDAWDQLMMVVENVYDNMEAGEERTITIRFNGVQS